MAALSNIAILYDMCIDSAYAGNSALPQLVPKRFNTLPTQYRLIEHLHEEVYLDPILIYISLWIDCLFEICKIAVCFPCLSMPGDYRVTDEALLAETT